MPEKIEKQEKMYPLTEELEAVANENWDIDSWEKIVAREKDGPHNLENALKLIIPDAEDKAELKRRAVLAYAVKAGFNVSLVHAGDSFQVKSVPDAQSGGESRFLYIKQYKGKDAGGDAVFDQYAVPIGSVYNMAHLDAGYELLGPGTVGQREKIKTKTRRSWQNLDEAFKSGILVDVMKALGLDSSYAARKELWESNMGAETVDELKTKNPRLEKLEEGEYKGAALQNLALIELLKTDDYYAPLDEPSVAGGPEASARTEVRPEAAAEPRPIAEPERAPVAESVSPAPPSLAAAPAKGVEKPAEKRDEYITANGVRSGLWFDREHSSVTEDAEGKKYDEVYDSAGRIVEGLSYNVDLAKLVPQKGYKWKDTKAKNNFEVVKVPTSGTDVEDRAAAEVRDMKTPSPPTRREIAPAEKATWEKLKSIAALQPRIQGSPGTGLFYLYRPGLTASGSDRYSIRIFPGDKIRINAYTTVAGRPNLVVVEVDLNNPNDQDPAKVDERIDQAIQLFRR